MALYTSLEDIATEIVIDLHDGENDLDYYFDLHADFYRLDEDECLALVDILTSKGLDFND